jgi:hypothetical protein
MDEGVRRVGTVIVRAAALFLGIFLFAIHGVTTGQTRPRLVHVFVALADNQHQGIVPVPATLGNGDDPGHNLYWGGAFGVRTFFQKSPEQKENANVPHPRRISWSGAFFKRTRRVLLVADAYRGTEIKQDLKDFFHSAASVSAKEPLFYSLIGAVRAIKFPRTRSWLFTSGTSA